MSVYKRGRTFWIKLRDRRGRVVRRSADTQVRAEAELLEGRLRREFGHDTNPVFDISEPARRMTFAELAKECLKNSLVKFPRSAAMFITEHKVLCREFGDEDVAGITPLRVTKFRNRRKDGLAVAGPEPDKPKPMAPATVNKSLAVLSGMLTRAKEEFSISIDNPVKRKIHYLEEPPPRKTHVRPAQMAAFMKGLGTFLWGQRLRIMVLMCTGLRRGNVNRLRARDLDFVQGSITAVRTKSNRTLHIPMPFLLKEPLRKLCAGKKPEEAVFAGVPGERARWSRMRKEIGLADLTRHDLRRTFATNFRRAGGDIRVLQEILDHSSLRTTEIYSSVDQEDRVAGMKKLDVFWDKDCALRGHGFDVQEKKAA